MERSPPHHHRQQQQQQQNTQTFSSGVWYGKVREFSKKMKEISRNSLHPKLPVD